MNEKLIRFFLFLLVIFILSVAFVMIDTNVINSSSYEFGYNVGHTMRYFIKITGILALTLFAIRKIKVLN